MEKKSKLFVLIFISGVVSINFLYGYSSSLNYDHIHSLIEAGSYDDALLYLDDAALGNPNDTDILFYYGYVLDEMGRYADALNYYDQILWYQPNDTDTLFNMAVTLENMGNFEEALLYYNKTLDIDPVDADALLSKGILLYELERYEEAVVAFENVLDIEIENSEARSYLNKIGVLQPKPTLNYGWIIMPVSILGGIGYAVFHHRRRQKKS